MPLERRVAVVDTSCGKVINENNEMSVLSVGRKKNEIGSFEEISSLENPTRTLK